MRNKRERQGLTTADKVQDRVVTVLFVLVVLGIAATLANRTMGWW